MSRAGLLLLATLLLLACGPASARVPPPAAQLTAPHPTPSHAPPPRLAAPEASEPGQDPARRDDHDPLLDLPGLRLFPARDGASDVTTMSCGDYTVERRDVGPSDLGHVRVLGAKGKVAYDARSSTGIDAYDVGWCFDLTRDGVPELEITHHSGGAHCCHRTIVLSLVAPRPIVLLDVDMGDGDVLSPADIDKQGAYELLGSSDALVSEGTMAYALTRLLPVVFALEGGRYVRSTRHFPARLRAERDEAVNGLAACEADEECLRGAGEYLLGLGLLIGDWDTQKLRLPLPAAVMKRVESIRHKLELHLAVER